MAIPSEGLLSGIESGRSALDDLRSKYLCTLRVHYIYIIPAFNPGSEGVSAVIITGFVFFPPLKIVFAMSKIVCVSFLTHDY